MEQRVSEKENRGTDSKRSCEIRPRHRENKHEEGLDISAAEVPPRSEGFQPHIKMQRGLTLKTDETKK